MAWFVLLGLIVTMLAWRLVTVRGRDVWITIPPLLGVLGLASILLWSKVPEPAPAGSDVPGAIGVLAIGAATGIALYAGTLVFVALAQRIPAFARQTALAYKRAATADPRRELLLSLLLAVPGEELFWRGIAYRVGVETAATAGLVAEACVDSGFRRLLFVNGHVGNAPRCGSRAIAFAGTLPTYASAWCNGGI